MDLKRCTVCKTEKGVSHFSKYKSAKDGLKSYCKKCASEQNKARREKNRDAINQKNKEWYYKSKEDKGGRTASALKQGDKECSYCHETKPVTSFYKRGNGGFYGECKDCHAKKSKVYVEDNREKVLSHKRKYYLRTRDRSLEYFKKYNLENSERNVERARGWAKRNPEKYRENMVRSFHRRRAKMKKLKNDFTREQWASCKDYFRKDNGLVECAYCNKELKNATQDHFIPVHKGGEHTAKNVLPVCLNCNSRKSASDFEEWYRNTPFYSSDNIEKIKSYFQSLERNQDNHEPSR